MVKPHNMDMRALRRNTDPETRFELSHIPEPNSGCWLWVGSTNIHGYGKILVRKKQLGAHRYSWMLHNGDIPKGLCVLHRCDNPTCVNPDHLFLGTRKENMMDMVNKGRNVPTRGESSGMAKLTEDQVLSIRNDSRPYNQIMIDFDISHGTISSIKSRKTWRHIQ